jgi:hypothetical protein
LSQTGYSPNDGGEVPSETMSHVTNLLYKEGIVVQIRWTHCNKTNNFQCCQYNALIRILPEEPYCPRTKFARPLSWFLAAEGQSVL